MENHFLVMVIHKQLFFSDKGNYHGPFTLSNQSTVTTWEYDKDVLISKQIISEEV